MYLGIRAVVAKSIARIHRKNLINYGILPLIFKDKNAYEHISAEAVVLIKGLDKIVSGENELIAEFTGSGGEIFSTKLLLDISDREKSILEQGGFLPYIKRKLKGA
jgi:aconitate hydratase